VSDELWAPSRKQIERTQLYRFMGYVNWKWKLAINDYDELWQWSIDQPENFWKSVWAFCEVLGQASPVVLENKENLLESRFFPSATLNYAENLLRRTGDDAAIICWKEGAERRQLSWNELHAFVSRLQQALSDIGVSSGDIIAGYGPNCPEMVVAMLAATSLGAVWTSCSPDFGVNGLLDRFGQVKPRVLFTADGYYYNGKQFDSIAAATALGNAIDGLDDIIVFPFLYDAPDITPLGKKGRLLQNLVAGKEARPLEFTQLSARHPLFIMYSSGTTGLPKCIVHGGGGTLLQHLKEHQLQCDLKSGDRLFYFTTCGWMMWNWQVSALASGVTLVLYDGSPTWPDLNCLPDIIEAEQVTHLGTSAKYLDAMAKAGARPVDHHDFSSLRVVLSTGSPLSEEGFRYVYEAWKRNVCLSSIAGGTDILGCFVGGNPIGPVYAGQCQKRLLGMNVRVFDNEGRSVEGEPGELVCLSPHPSMPLGFWNDSANERYEEAYFSKFANVWCHGDYVVLTPEGGMVFKGRSDATLNPGGVRIGTAEIYRQVQNIEAVEEPLVIGQEWGDDLRVVLFVKLKEGYELSDALKERIKTEIRNNASPRHVPAKIIAVADIPRTLSGKITELAVRDIVHGRPVKNREALANPEALDLFRDLSELKSEF
jgi:acetoacetyl-CoA synthetase